MSRGLPLNVKLCLDKALDSALLSVETYNKPAVKFKSGGYIVLMCTGLQEAYIGDGVTEIAAKAFAECTALKTVVIGKSIQRIGDQAFNTRSSWDQMTLEKITVLFDDIASGSFPVLESGSRGVFPKPGGWDLVSYKIYVPKGTKAEYQKNWSDYSSLIVEMQ